MRKGINTMFENDLVLYEVEMLMYEERMNELDEILDEMAAVWQAEIEAERTAL